MLKRGVFLVTQDVTTHNAVASGLEGNHGVELAGVCPELRDLAPHLRQSLASAVLVDIDPKPRQILGDLNEVITHNENTRFVVLSNEIRNDLVLEAMQVGARYFLLKQSIPVDIGDVMQRLLSNGTTQENVLVTVLSASGGCGATTVAINLSHELQLATRRSTLLVDLDSTYGAVANHLGVKGEHSVADLLSGRGDIDSVLVRTTAQAYSERLEVLLSPASIDFCHPQPLNLSHLEEALLACKDSYDYTVVDAPRASMDLAAKLARASALTFVAFQLSVKDMLLLRRTLDALIERNVPQDRILALANRFRKRGDMIQPEEAHKVLNGVALETVGNDFRSTVLGINMGKPLADVAPRSTARRDIERLAARVAELHLSSTSQSPDR